MPFPLFDEYAKLFAQAGVDLFMVGGTSRDYLLGKEIRDVDFVSASTPEETLKILGEGNDRFAKYGTITLKKGDTAIDFMTFREEGGYTDSRHPTQIRFITDMERDSYRRDFTINAIYIGRDYQIHDFHGGMADLEAGLSVSSAILGNGLRKTPFGSCGANASPEDWALPSKRKPRKPWMNSVLC
ncbi:MAG: CCA tRNA nucleotidyltransferase [Bacilli bacterium]|nr:CCA tRNA nucleotidyltransferase [Bacilli bacterium]